MATKQLFTLLLSTLSFAASAQEYNPYKSIGKKAKILTLSKGKYLEFFDLDSIQRIGTVMYNIRTHKIVKLLNSETVYKKASNNTSSSRWWSVDPLADKFASYSPYNYVENNPINKTDPTGKESKSVHIDDKGNVLRNYNDGDNSVYVHAKGITGNDVDKSYISTKGTAANGLKIGELGKNIDVNGVLSNVLAENKNETKSGLGGMTPIGWYNRVKFGGKWDYKDNASTVFGVAWKFDDAQKKITGKDDHTNFLYKGFSYNGQFNAADVGNFNAGYTGTHVGLYNIVQQIGAGFVERNKNGASFDPSQYTHSPYGDQVADYLWNTKGMNDAQNEINHEPKPIFFK